MKLGVGKFDSQITLTLRFSDKILLYNRSFPTKVGTLKR